MQSDLQVLLGTGHEGPEGEYRYGSTLSLNLALDRGGLTTPHTSSFNLGKEPWYPLHRRVGGPQSQSAWVWNILPPLRFHPWTVQSIVSHYTNYTILKSALHKKNLWASKYHLIIILLGSKEICEGVLKNLTHVSINMLSAVEDTSVCCRHFPLYHGSHILWSDTLSCHQHASTNCTQSLWELWQ
jgi:hypothetical protein